MEERIFTADIVDKTAEKIVISDGITKINYGAFEYCESLTEVIIPDSVTEIGNCAFYGCTNFKELNFPEGITEMEL